MKMKVCFVVDNILAGAGVENMTIALANGLVNLNYNVSIVVLYHSTKSTYTVDRRIFLYALNSLYSEKIKSILKLRSFLKQYKPNYLITVCAHLGIITIPASIFLNIRNIIWEHFNYTTASNTGKIIRCFSSLLSYKFITLTDQDKRNYPSLLSHKIIPIPNFISDVPDYIPKEDKENYTVLAVGRYSVQKGFDLLLKAWKLVHKQCPEYRLKILGARENEKDYVLKLRDLAANMNIADVVDFIPATKSISNYYKNTDLFVLSSRSEGFPLCLLEAKSFALPIVSFDCLYGPRILINNGVDGFLVEANNIDKLSDAIVYLLKNKNERLKMGENARRDLMERFSQERILEKWSEILK